MIPITNRRKSEEERGWKNVVIKILLDKKLEISKKEVDMSLKHIIAF